MAEKKSKKGWKDALLSSSLPLEYSVTEILHKLGVSDAAEFRYERPNETGELTTFSIDVHGSKLVNKDRVAVEMFIECKYRHQSTKWVFLPHAFSAPKDARYEDAFISLDVLTTSNELNWSVFNTAAMAAVICGKGIELYEDNSNNPKTIAQAITQLQYSLVKKAVACMADQMDEFVGFPDRVFVLVPIIVTTAELWRLNPKTTIEDIKGADDLSKVAKAVEILLVRDLPSNELQRYTSRYMRETFLASDQAAIEVFLKPRMHRPRTFNDLVQWYAESYPSIFLVVQYKGFEKRVSNILGFFDKPELIRARSKGPN